MEIRVRQPVRIIDTSLARHVMPFLNGQPAYVVMDETSDIFLPVFSSLDKLLATMTACGVLYDNVKKIDDQAVFLASIPTQLPDGTNLRIIIDPERHDDGTIRFAEVLREENKGYLQ